MPSNSTTPTPIRACLRCNGSMQGRANQARRCAECAKQHKNEYDRNYQKGRPESLERKAYRNDWAKKKRAKNPEFVEDLRAWHRAFYAAKRTDPGFLEQERERGKQRWADPTKRPDMLAASRRYGHSEKGKAVAVLGAHRRRVNKTSQLGTVSKDIKAKLQQAQGNKCGYCKISLKRRKAELDHIIPLALGGQHDDANLQVICFVCNRSKGAKDPIEFARSRGMLL